MHEPHQVHSKVHTYTSGLSTASARPQHSQHGRRSNTSAPLHPFLCNVCNNNSMRVYQSLRAGVVDGSLITTGQRTTESVLAGHLAVSRTPVREALQRLDAEGLVIATGRGVTARRLSEQELHNTYRTRAVLEGAAAEAVADAQGRGLLRPAELAGLEQLNEATDAATRADDLDEAIHRNRRFHRRIAELADNTVTLALLDLLWDRIIITTRATLGPQHRTLQVAAEHRDILVAICDGESAAARRASISHVLATIQAFRKY